MGELGVCGQYQSRGNRYIHKAYNSIVYIFEDNETEMTELPHIQRAHFNLLPLNGQMHAWHERNQKWKKGSSFLGLRHNLKDIFGCCHYPFGKNRN
jgi:hypothetical protein